MNLCFLCSAPFKHFMKVQMCNRCPPSRFPISLHACSGSWGGGHYCILAERLDELQMRRKGGPAGMAASSICFTCVSDGCSLTYRPSVSLISEQHKTENIKDTHKGRGIPGFYSLHLRVLETHTGHSGPVRVGGGAPGVKTWLENSFCVRERRKVLCVIRPPSLSDIFSRAGPSESPQNAGHFFWSMLS